MSSSGLLIVALVVFLATMGSRMPWTRPMGWILVLLGLALGIAGGLGDPARHQWAHPDVLPAVLFIVLAAVSFWLTMHWEQEPAIKPADLSPSDSKSTQTVDPARGFRHRSLGVSLGIVVVAFLAWRLPPGVPAAEASNPWFLAGLEEISFWIGPLTAWVLLPLVILTCLLAAPFLDTREPEIQARFQGRSDEVPFFFFAWWFLGLLPIAIGAWLRPLGLVDPEPNPVPAAEKLWIHGLGSPMPDLWWIRELPTLLILLVLFVLLPWRMPTWKPTQGAFNRHRRRLGRRYWPAMILVAAVVWLCFAYVAGSVGGIGPWLGPVGLGAGGGSP